MQDNTLLQEVEDKAVKNASKKVAHRERSQNASLELHEKQRLEAELELE